MLDSVNILRRGRLKTIRARLNLAFGVAATMTVVSSLVGLYAFTGIGGTTTEIVSRNLPATVESLRLAEETSALLALAPRLMAAKDDQSRSVIADEIAMRAGNLAARGGRLHELDPAGSPEIDAARSAMIQRLSLLDLAVIERNAIAGKRQAQALSIRKAHEDLLEALIPAIDDANFELMYKTPTAGSRTALTASLESLRRLLEVQAEANLLAGVLTEASLVTETARLQPLRDVVDSARRKIDGNIPALLDAELKRNLSKLYGPLARIGGPDGIIALRAEELAKENEAEIAFAASQREAASLKRAVDGLVERQGTSAQAVSAHALLQVRSGQALLVALSVGALVAGGLMAWLYVGRSITRRLGLLSNAMRQIAAGDMKAAVPDGGQDEIAEMARTLVVFRNATAEVTSAREAEALRARASEERRQQIETSTREFERAVSEIIEALESASKAMDGSARAMTESAGRNEMQAQAVAVASKETTANVSHVAAGAEQIAQSVEHVSRKVIESAAVAREAAGQAKEITAAVADLAASIGQISEVSNLIKSIAAQTNLLALNATIEAARAGDAGRGFAVVAQEVKSLAAQTGRATEDITRQIQSIEQTTARVVGSMNLVAATIAQLDDIAGVVTVAVQQQGAVTQEIAASAGAAAAGTRDVSQNIGEVSKVATETGETADTVLGAANALSGRSRVLKHEVECFLAKVRAA